MTFQSNVCKYSTLGHPLGPPKVFTNAISVCQKSKKKSISLDIRRVM